MRGDSDIMKTIVGEERPCKGPSMARRAIPFAIEDSPSTLLLGAKRVRVTGYETVTWTVESYMGALVGGDGLLDVNHRHWFPEDGLELALVFVDASDFFLPHHRNSSSPSRLG